MKPAPLFFVLTLSASLSACMYRAPYSLPSPKLGPSYDSPVSIVSGDSSEWDFLWFKPIGNASAQTALKNAERRQNVNADGIVNAQVERTLYCFPLCIWPLAQFVKTTFTGTLLKNSLIAPYQPIPITPKPQLLHVGEMPSPESLESSLESLYRQNPDEAEKFYESLGLEERGNVRDMILLEKGKLDKEKNFFFIPQDASPRLKSFLDWFIIRFTPYIPR